MWWHMPTTNSSPIGSTSMSAPQYGSQNSPLPSSLSLETEIEEAVRRADVELHPFEDRLDVGGAEAQQVLDALGVDRARAHPFGDGDLAHGGRAVARQNLRHADAILQVRSQSDTRVPAPRARRATAARDETADRTRDR